MNAPLKNSFQRGFSVLELLIVVVMVAVITGFALVNIVQGHRAIYRTNTAAELAGHLQKARVDSMHRTAKAIEDMAHVTILNPRFYTVAIDENGDGFLDTPKVINLPEEQGVEIKGPFPRMFIFNWLGQTVDAENHQIQMPAITITNISGASAVRISETGKPVVVSR